jgi:hypothetical protein
VQTALPALQVLHELLGFRLSDLPMNPRNSQMLRGLAYSTLAGLLVFGLFEVIKLGRPPSASTPGIAQLREASDTIRGQHGSGYGNDDQAQHFAAEMSGFMLTFRDKYYTHLKRKSFRDEDDEFRTYCQLREGQCAFLIHVPELRRFNVEAKRSLSQGAWIFAQKLLDKNGQPAHLAVALQGLSSYERVLIGEYVPGSKLKPEVHNFNPEKQLLPWFAPRPATTNEAAPSETQASGASTNASR